MFTRTSILPYLFFIFFKTLSIELLFLISSLKSWKLNLLSFQLKDLFQSEKLKNTVQYVNFSKACPEKEEVANNSLASTGYLDSYVMLERWKNGVSLEEMAMLNVSSFFR